MNVMRKQTIMESKKQAYIKSPKKKYVKKDWSISYSRKEALIDLERFKGGFPPEKGILANKIKELKTRKVKSV